MKIDYEAPIRDLDDEPMVLPDGPLLIGSVIVNSLLAPQKEPLPGEESLHRYMVAMAVKKGEGITVEDAALIKKVVPSTYGPLVYGRVVEALEDE